MAISLGTIYDVIAGNGNGMHACALDDTHIVYVYTNGQQDVKVKIGVLDGTDIAFGNEYTITTDDYGGYCKVCKIDSTHFAVVFNAASGSYSYNGRVVIGSVANDDEITLGSVVNLYTDGFPSAPSFQDVKLLDSSHVIISYKRYDSGNMLLACKIGTISGTSISLGSEYSTSKAGNAGMGNLAVLDSTHFVISFSTGVKIGTVNGSYEISFGSEQVFDSNADGQKARVCAVDSTHIVVMYSKNISGYGRQRCIAGSISAGTITWGTIANVYLENLLALEEWCIDAISSTKFLILYFVDFGGGQYYAYTEIGTISGTTISWSQQTGINYSQVSSNVTQFCSKITANKYVFGFNDSSDSNQFKTVIGEIPVTTLSDNAIFFGCNC